MLLRRSFDDLFLWSDAHDPSAAALRCSETHAGRRQAAPLTRHSELLRSLFASLPYAGLLAPDFNRCRAVWFVVRGEDCVALLGGGAGDVAARLLAFEPDPKHLAALEAIQASRVCTNVIGQSSAVMSSSVIVNYFLDRLCLESCPPLRSARSVMYMPGPTVIWGMSMTDESSVHDILAMTAQIVSAHVKSNSVPPDALPDLIRDVHRAVSSLGAAPPPPPERPQPAVPIKKSIFPATLFAWKTARS